MDILKKHKEFEQEKAFQRQNQMVGDFGAYVKKYLTAKETCAAEVYAATFEWLKAHGCAEVVTPQLVENYSQTIGRHIQCEKILSSEGLIGEHPTTGAPIASPFVKMSLDYLKSAQQLWYQIWQIVRENAVQGAGDSANDEMENILRLVK